MLFGNFEEVTSDEFATIVENARQNHQEVKGLDIVVNINGQIMRPGAGVEGLPKGIYIINGKKYLVK